MLNQQKLFSLLDEAIGILKRKKVTRLERITLRCIRAVCFNFRIRERMLGELTGSFYATIGLTCIELHTDRFEMENEFGRLLRHLPYISGEEVGLFLEVLVKNLREGGLYTPEEERRLASAAMIEFQISL